MKGKGKKGQQVSPWNKGKAKFGKGVYQSYKLWDMEEGQREDGTRQSWPLGALTLFSLNEDFPKWRQVPKKASKKLNNAEGFNVSRPTAIGTVQPRSGEPMRVDILDLISKPICKSKHCIRFEFLGSLEENNDDEDIVQNPDVQTSGSLDNAEMCGGNKKKWKKVTKSENPDL